MSVPSVPRARSRLAVEAKAAKRKSDPSSKARVAAARRDLAAANLEAYISRVVSAAPPLTDDQRSRLALLLHGVGERP
jgi:hypothetical protein